MFMLIKKSCGQEAAARGAGLSEGRGELSGLWRAGTPTPLPTGVLFALFLMHFIPNSCAGSEELAVAGLLQADVAFPNASGLVGSQRSPGGCAGSRRDGGHVGGDVGARTGSSAAKGHLPALLSCW